MAPGAHSFRVAKPGYHPLVTEIFDDADKYVLEDAVFGVRDSLVVPFRRVDDQAKAEQVGLKAPFYKVDFDFNLAPE